MGGISLTEKRPGKRREREGKREIKATGDEGMGWEGCSLQLGTLDPAVEEGRQGRRAACAGASRQFFPLEALAIICSFWQSVMFSTVNNYHFI